LQSNDKRQRLPIDIALLERIIKCLRSGCFGTYDDVLMTCCCIVAFSGVLRCGEFTINEKVVDNHNTLQLDDIKLRGDHLLLHLNHSKTDPFRQGIEITIYAYVNNF
jgi:hypothetical protein